MSKPSDSRVALRYPNFLRHAGSRVLSVLASEMQAVAVGWQIYGLTHRPLDLGLVGLAQFLPGILLFLVAGHAADRFPRKRILQTCAAGYALVSVLLFAFTIHGIKAIYPIYLVLLLNGTARAFSMPASQALLPSLVSEAHFANAIAWGSSWFQTATILGPIAGGLIYGVAASPLPVYALAAVSYLAAFLLYSRIDMKLVRSSRKAAAPEMVWEGLHYIWKNKFILGAISLDLFAVLLGGAVALLPVYAREILAVGATGLGILRSAPGVGAILTALLLAHHPLGKRQGTFMLCCVCGFGLFTVLFGVSRSVALSLVALALTGACDMVSVVVRSTMVQLNTPDHMRGRVSAVNMVFIGASNEVGQFESGITAQWFGTVPAVVLGGIGTIVVVALWTWLFPQLRRAPERVTVG
ncbi:MAG TPA: MFS transporter [Bryobacteraceae bacterium]|jgi:MFS family permease|nr:MFS transporter [Bryobacteraceae bacterium]